MRKITLAPGQLLRSVNMEKSYLSNAGYPLTGKPPLEVALGQQKLMWTVGGVRACTEAMLSLGSMSCPGVMSYPGIIWKVLSY